MSMEHTVILSRFRARQYTVGGKEMTGRDTGREGQKVKAHKVGNDHERHR